MASPIQPPAHPIELPLISNGLLVRLTALATLLAMLTIAISVCGRWLGDRIALAGHTASTAVVAVTIGQDRLDLPVNSIRFARQRASGLAERVDLQLTWPEMAGFSAATRWRFDDVAQSGSLLFLQMSQSTMSRDMSGRLQPIYAHLYDGAPEAGPAGLTLHRLKPEAGYGGEVILTAPRAGEPDYVVRCLLPADPRRASSGDCQRDIHIGRDLSVLYRFSSALLGDWHHIDAGIQSFVRARLAEPS